VTRPRLLFWVQHLLGIGHLRRAATLTRGLRAARFDVTLASGGFPVPGLSVGSADFAQLPPARAVDVYFKDLRDADDRPLDDAWRADRRRHLLDLYESVQPDVVLTELFPFGRRQFAFEVEPLLEAARADPRRPLVAASVRDILVQPGKPERIDEMIARAERWYDQVLVHGDPALVGFEETFPRLAAIADRVRYTGYVVESRRSTPPRNDRGDSGEILVSAGGGAVSEPLLRAAIAARPLSRAATAPWRILVGHSLPDAVFADLKAMSEAGVTVERARPDFTRLLRSARLSISQGGYNTVMEVLDARVPAVIVPYAGGLETEQTLRAERLAARTTIQVVPEQALDPAHLARAVDSALAAGPPTLDSLDMAGARTTPRLLRTALAAHRRGR